jgi:ketosteroid isomerase-like protein
MPNPDVKRNFGRASRPAQLVLFAATILALCAGFASRSSAKPPETPDEAQIRALLVDQTAAWNRCDMDGFMAGYWKSDETEFVSADGISRGWQALLDRYKRSYPDRKAMGRLSFANLEIRVECPNSAYAIGEFHLEREKDNPAGIFTLNLKKFPEGWRVVVDHTTAFAPPKPDSK